MGTKVEFERCLKKKGLRISADARHWIKKELGDAANDLHEAESGLTRESYKWSTVQSYYAMFHAARALLYAKGYREKSHYCLRIAIEVLYVEPGDMPQHMINAFEVAKELRENADYESESSESGAEKLVKAAQEFLKLTKMLCKEAL
jgi:uncharacterized protein (UPF0332 family)